jgi:vacuolar-type H+-ATPase subunit E/Vma4
MAPTKQEITQGIVDTIIETVQEESRSIMDQYNRDIDQELNNYRVLKDEAYAQKIAVYQEKIKNRNVKLEASLSFEVNRNLRLHRVKLLEQLSTELYQRLLDYSKTPAYYDWLVQTIRQYQQGTLYIRESDRDYIQTNMNIVIKPLELGGFLVELDARVLDFTLNARFEAVMKSFTKTSSLEIGVI